MARGLRALITPAEDRVWFQEPTPLTFSLRLVLGPRACGRLMSAPHLEEKAVSAAGGLFCHWLGQFGSFQFF